MAEVTEIVRLVTLWFDALPLDQKFLFIGAIVISFSGCVAMTMPDNSRTNLR